MDLTGQNGRAKLSGELIFRMISLLIRVVKGVVTADAIDYPNLFYGICQ